MKHRDRLEKKLCKLDLFTYEVDVPQHATCLSYLGIFVNDIINKYAWKRNQ
jgi:hypothetical protein